MNHLILPREFLLGTQSAGDIKWIDAPGLGLGGCFYDYFRLTDGAVVGVRYWIMGSLDFRRHPVYSQFLNDSRFSFDESGTFVDIFFEENGGLLERRGIVSLDMVQDFGGDDVVRHKNWYGIAFSLAIDSEE
jgi:hypothetical protein